MSTRFLIALAFVAALVVTPAAALAEALVKPVPTPDLSKLPAADATELREFRTTFDQKRLTLVGDPLAEAYSLLGAAYAQKGFFDAASVALENASLLAPKDGRWVYLRGLLARASKQEAVAQNFFELALQLDKEYLPIRIAVARVKLANGDTEGARRLLAEYVASHTDQAIAYAFLGEVALRQKRHAEAITQVQRALALDPAATQLYALLAEAETGAGNAKAAAAARSRAGPVAPTLSDTLGEGFFGVSPALRTVADPTTKDLAEVARLLGQGQYGSARKRLDDALKRTPNDATVLALYARVEAASGNLAAAKSRAAAAVAADKESALANLSQGVAQEMSGDDGAARRAYEAAVRLDPKLAEPRELLGTLLMRTGRNEDAITQYRELVRQQPRNREYWMRLVAAYVMAGRCAGALADVSEMLGLDDKNKFMLEVFVRLASTCPAASAKERLGALEHGGKLYRENATATVSEAYALALAANGRWDEAVQTQQAAMFMLVRRGLKDAISGHRDVLLQLQARKMPKHPWPASAVLFHPQRLAPNPKPAAAPPRR